MAIAFDSGNTTTGHVLGSGTADSWSFTNTAGNFMVLHMLTNTTAASFTVTYNGVAMSKLGASITNGTLQSQCYYLVNPATGANTVSMSWTGASYCYSTAASYSGVNTASPIDSNSSNTSASATTLTASTTVGGSNCWTVTTAMGGNGNNPSAGAGTTLRSLIALDSFVGILDSNGTVGTGLQSLIANFSPAQAINMIIFSIAPAASASSSGNNFFVIF